jgi:hypothetical protein
LRSRIALTLLPALAAAAVLVPAPALARGAAAEGNSTTFTDSTGENANAPDITTIVVSNNDAGLITFKVNISNRPALTPDMTVWIFLDTDRNASTGDTNGAEYLLELDPGALTLFHWNGSDYVAASSQSSVTFGYDATGATMRASAADLGNVKAFDFYALAISGIAIDASGNPDFSNANGDSAPDAGHGDFTYNVLTTLTLSVAAFTTSPSPAKAGKTFVASLAVNESDTNGPVDAGTVACSATVAGKRLAAKLHRVANGVATCSWSLPKTAKGTIKGTVSLTAKGKSVARSFSVKIG